MDLKLALEALLFREGREMTFAELSNLFKVETNIVVQALKALSKDYDQRGIRLVLTDRAAVFATAPDYSRIIRGILKKEQTGNLTPAALDTLTIILYTAPVTKADIDYIRGVNSGTILRTLAVRDLIERRVNEDGRSHSYVPTATVLRHLGVTDVKELSDYEKNRTELTTFLESRD